MWIPRWLWERYKELRLKMGLNNSFSFKLAKKIFSYDSDEMIYKTLNKLEKLNIIDVERSKKDNRAKTYKIVLELKDIPYSDITIPTDYPQEPPSFLASTGSAAIFGTTSVKPSVAFHRMYSKDGQQQITIVPKPIAKTIEEYLVENIKNYKSAEPILSIIKLSNPKDSKGFRSKASKPFRKSKAFSKSLEKLKTFQNKEKIEFKKVIGNLNSFQRRYLGALLEILDKDKCKGLIEELYNLTKNDNRKFSIFPKQIKKVPEEYKRIAKKWRINLNIDVVNIDEL